MKKITICGSMKFFSGIEQLKKELEGLGYTVLIPIKGGKGTDYSKLPKKEQADMKQFFIDKHIEKIQQSDAILVANYTKDNKKDYIGANTFLEMACAYVLKKKIFILNSMPEQANTVEIAGLKPVLLKGNLQNICPFSQKTN